MNEVRRRGDLVVVIVDAANLARNLTLVGQLLAIQARIIVCLNMTDVAARRGITVDPAALSARLGVPVVPMVAAKAEGIDTLRHTLRRAAGSIGPDDFRARDLPMAGAPHRVLTAWARTVADEVTSRSEAHRRRTRPGLGAYRPNPDASGDRDGHLHAGDGRAVLGALLAGGRADGPDRCDVRRPEHAGARLPAGGRDSRPADRRSDWRHCRHGRVPAADLFSVLPDQPARRHRISGARGVRDGSVPLSHSACPATRSSRC